MARDRSPEPSRWVTSIRFGLLGVALGFGIGILVTGIAGVLGGEFWFHIIPIYMVAIGAALYLYSVYVIEGSGKLVKRLFMGGKMKPTAEYSYADSLVIRGMYDAAITAYEEAAKAEPGDPEPFLRTGRVLRDKLHRIDDAVAAFRKARASERASQHQVNMATREIIETLLYREDERQKAIPELARLAEQAAGTTSGDWALRRLEELKQELAWTIKGQGQGQAQAQGEAGDGRPGVGGDPPERDSQ